MVEQGFDGFKRQWQERAAHRRVKSDWATTDVVPKGKETKAKEDYEEALSPGSIVKLALGERFKSADVFITNNSKSRMLPSSRSGWQQKLCKVLVDVCMPDGSTKVSPSAIKETPNYLLYLKLEVHGNRTFVGNVLSWREIGFLVEIKGRNNEVIKKHFAINLHSKRFRRSLVEKSIPHEYEFPDYYQHKCCGCVSGCSPVAWAQVFGFYDRIASRYSGSIFSPTIYGNSSTVAPLYLTSEVERFVEDIRSQVKTYCGNGAGWTKNSNMHLIAPWFRARQGSKSRVVSYLQSRKRRGIGGGASVQRGGSSWIESKAVGHLKLGYPVILNIFLAENSGHSVVATKYKERSRSYRVCHSRRTGWWWWKRTKQNCSWKTAYDYEFFLHYGWENPSETNKWQEVSPFAGFNAYIAKY